MSVGGKVVEVIPLEDRIWVNTREQVWYPPEQRWHDGSECAIYVQRTFDAERIQPGDSLWWQGRDAYWTPKDRSVEDMPIPRIGYSGVSRPGTAV